MAAAIVENARRVGRRVLFLVHRRELLQQASKRLHTAGIDHGIVAADFPSRPGAPVQIGSISTLHARAVRTSVMNLPPADLVIIDEAHHARAKSWRRLLEAYPDAGVVGLTATPCRGDGRGLGTIFETMVETPSIAELTVAGYLVPTIVYAPTKPDLAGVRIERGDYNEAQLAERMDRPQLVGDIVTHWHRLAEGRRTIIFATNVAHSVHLAGEFCRSGVVAEHLDGETPAADRDAILRRLSDGATDIVTNVGVLTEGFDCPDVGCIVLGRPTKSIALYRQIVGRGLRPAPGKLHCLILDHAGATHEHGLIDEPIAWTLSADSRPERPAKKARDEGRAPRLTECPECTAVRWAGSPCKSCGWKPRPRPVAVAVVDEDLGHIDRNGVARRPRPTRIEQDRFHAELAWIAIEKAYAAGWIAHKFKEKFGTWPSSRSAPKPMEPRPETRSWIRSRVIAFAKARGGAGAP